MKRIFIDTNVLFDVLTNRAPFCKTSSAVWALCEKGQIKGFVSTSSFNNIYYITKRMTNRSVALQNITIVRDVFNMVALDEQVINQSIDSDLPDFEDAIQYFSAVRCDAECIITRNKKDFRQSDIPVLSPQEFLNTHPCSYTTE